MSVGEIHSPKAASFDGQGLITMSAIDRMSFNDFQAYCRETEQNFRASSLDDYTRSTWDRSAAEYDALIEKINELLTQAQHESIYWRGQATVAIASGPIDFEIYLAIRSTEQNYEEKSVKSMCWDMFLSASLPGQSPKKLSTVAGGCDGFTRWHQDVPMSEVSLYSDRDISPYLNFLLVPFPTAPGAPLSFQPANQREWTETSFHWGPITEQEYQEFQRRSY